MTGDQKSEIQGSACVAGAILGIPVCLHPLLFGSPAWVQARLNLGSFHPKIPNYIRTGHDVKFQVDVNVGATSPHAR